MTKSKIMNKKMLEEQVQLLREKVLQAEQERLDDAETITISEARKRLRERILDNNQ